MKKLIKAGQTSYLDYIFIQDTSQADGRGLTGLAYNTAGLAWYYRRPDGGNAGGVAVTLATMTRGTWATGGFVEVDATNLPGVYEISVPNAAIAAGTGTVVMALRGATNMAPVMIEYELNAPVDVEQWQGTNVASPNTAGVPVVDGRDVIAYGTAQGGAATTITLAASTTTAQALGNMVLIIGGTGVGQAAMISSFDNSTKIASIRKNWATTPDNTSIYILLPWTYVNVEMWNNSNATSQAVGGVPDVNTQYWKAAAIPTPNTSGVPIVDLKYILGTILTETAGQIAAGFKKFFNVGSPAISVNDIPSNVELENEFDAVHAHLELVPSASDNATGLLDAASGIETSYTVRQALRIMLAAMAGKLSGAATTSVAIRDVNDTKNRIAATVDSSGNRSSVTLDGS